MTDFLPPDDPVLKSAWIERAPPQAVAGWLSQACRHDVLALFPEGALQKLLARRDAFINLAVALYGDDPAVLRELWGQGDIAIRRAILRNENRDGGLGDRGLLDFLRERDELLAFLKGASWQDIQALATNRTLTGRALTAIFERTGPFAALPVDQWRIIAGFALQNPNLHQRNQREYPEDDYEARLAREQAMQLLLDFPVEAKWADYLETGFAKFKRLNIPTKAEWSRRAEREFLDAVFKRWSTDSTDDVESVWRYAALRMTIAALVPNYDKEFRGWVELYPDKWVQIGAAKTKEFRAPEEVQELFDRYRKTFLEYVAENPSLHHRNNPAVVVKIRTLVQSFDQEPLSWLWTNAASRFYDQAPNRFFRWDENIEVSEDQDSAPAQNPTVHRLDELFDSLKTVKAELNATLSQSFTEIEIGANKRQADLIQAMSDGDADIRKGMQKLWILLECAVAVVVVVIFLLWTSHH